MTVNMHFPRANTTTDCPSLPIEVQAETMDVLMYLATATAADRAMVATLTVIIARLSSELAAAQAKLMASLMDNQRLLKNNLTATVDAVLLGVAQTVLLLGVQVMVHGTDPAFITAIHVF